MPPDWVGSFQEISKKELLRLPRKEKLALRCKIACLVRRPPVRKTPIRILPKCLSSESLLVADKWGQH